MLSMLEVKDRLGPYHALLVGAHLNATKRLNSVAKRSPEFVAAFNATERANVLHGQIRSLTAIAVESVRGVSMTAWDVDTVAVGTDLLVRLKHLGQRGTPANVQTVQQVLLSKQQYKEEVIEILSLSGIQGAPTLVTCGYSMDGLDISTIMIRRDCIGHNPWTYGIYGSVAIVEPLMLPTIEDVKPAIVRSTRRKPGKSEKDANDTGSGG
jgi:hypothetical protein